jgi:hypothetical protein
VYVYCDLIETARAPTAPEVKAVPLPEAIPRAMSTMGKRKLPKILEQIAHQHGTRMATKRKVAKMFQTGATPIRIQCHDADISTSEVPQVTTAEVYDESALTSSLKYWIKQNRNQNTDASYTSAWNQFERWCQDQDPPMPCDPPSDSVVAAYIKYLITEKDVPMASARIVVSAIGDAMKFAGTATESTTPGTSTMVRTMMNVLKPLAKSSVPKKALTIQQLKAMASRVYANTAAITSVSTDKNGKVNVEFRDMCIVLLGFTA